MSSKSEHIPSGLTEEEQDTLQELFNIAFGRAAASLAHIVDRRIVLHPPRLQLCQAKDVTAFLPTPFQEPLIQVRQRFQGPFQGEARMLLRREDLLHLLALTEIHETPHHEILGSDLEAFAEIGNIILNTVVSTFHLVTGEHFRISLPQTAQLPPPSLASFPLPEWISQTSVAILAITHMEIAPEKLAFTLVVFLERDALHSLVQSLEHLIPNHN